MFLWVANFQGLTVGFAHLPTLFFSGGGGGGGVRGRGVFQRYSRGSIFPMLIFSFSFLLFLFNFDPS